MEWYYVHAGGQRVGPVNQEELDRLFQSGTINLDTLVWRAGMADWQPYSVSKRMGPGLAAGASAQGTPGMNLIFPSVPPKDPALMGILSGCCIAGLGQMIMGQAIKGVIILVTGICFAIVTAGLGAPIVWLVSGIDAYMVANKLKNGRPVGQWEFF